MPTNRQWLKVHDFPKFTHDLTLELERPLIISPYLQTVLAAMEKKNQFSLIWLSRVALSVTLNVHTTVSKEFSSLLREQGRVWHLWHIKERASKGVS